MPDHVEVLTFKKPVDVSRIRVCEHCGNSRGPGTRPHAPRMKHLPDGRWVKVDCRGVVVP